MEDVMKIASYICQRYECQFGARIEEMKLHILLYFAQRECMVQTENPLFDAVFYAQSFGPFLPKVHTCYSLNMLSEKLPESAAREYESVFDEVFASLARKSSRSLSNLVHGESSWKKAFAQGGNTPISLDDIRNDANRFRARCFLLNHLDEFRKPAYV